MSNFFSLLNSPYSNEFIKKKINIENFIPTINVKSIGLKILMSESNIEYYSSLPDSKAFPDSVGEAESQTELRRETMNSTKELKKSVGEMESIHETWKSTKETQELNLQPPQSQMNHPVIQDISIQPIIINNIVLLCYGEIYNSNELFNYINTEPQTNYSYEIIIHLYKLYGIEHTLRIIDGVFSFLLLDNNIESENFKLYIARDSYGLKPLYILNSTKRNNSNSTELNYRNDSIIGFSTDKHMLYEIYKELLPNSFVFDSRVSRLSSVCDSTSPINRDKTLKSIKETSKFSVDVSSTLSNNKLKGIINNSHFYELKQFIPGTYSSYILSSKLLSSWVIKKENIRFHMHGYNSLMYSISPQYNDKSITNNIQNYLIRSIEKRCNMYGSHYACFLNGEIQNTIIAGILNQYNTIHNYPKLKTYSIGFENSMELQNSKKVAEYLKTEHTEITINNDFFNKEFIESIIDLDCYNDLFLNENNHTKFIIQYLIGQYIKDNNIVYIFNGNGANEIFGSLFIIQTHASATSEFSASAPSSTSTPPLLPKIKEPIQYDLMVRNTIEKIFLNDILSYDISLYYNGFIPSSPFLDRSFVEYYLSIPPQIRFDSSIEIDKYFLRLAFSKEYYINTENLEPIIPNYLLPNYIIWN